MPALDGLREISPQRGGQHAELGIGKRLQLQKAVDVLQERKIQLFLDQHALQSLHHIFLMTVQISQKAVPLAEHRPSQQGTIAARRVRFELLRPLSAAAVFLQSHGVLSVGKACPAGQLLRLGKEFFGRLGRMLPHPLQKLPPLRHGVGAIAKESLKFLLIGKGRLLQALHFGDQRFVCLLLLRHCAVRDRSPCRIQMRRVHGGPDGFLPLRHLRGQLLQNVVAQRMPDKLPDFLGRAVQKQRAVPVHQKLQNRFPAGRGERVAENGSRARHTVFHLPSQQIRLLPELLVGQLRSRQRL